LSIQLVTALADAEIEDRLIATLVDDDFLLKKRCYLVNDLVESVSLIAEDQRLLIVVDDELGLTPRERDLIVTEQVSLLEIPSRLSLAPEEIKARAREALRNPDLAIPVKRKYQRRDNFIAFTGSSGSPGISTVGLNVASELSEKRALHLIDADPHRQDLLQRLGLQNSENLQLTPYFSIKSIDTCSSLDSQDLDNNLIYLIDIGAAPYLPELFTDRRKTGKFYFEILQQCGNVVYIAQPENSSLTELERFKVLMRDNFPAISTTYVLNKAGGSNRQRAFHKSFKSRLGGDQGFYLPREYSVLDRAQSQYSTLMEVAPRSGLRKAIRELSIYLDKSF
jgi:hypothetical protein